MPRAQPNLEEREAMYKLEGADVMSRVYEQKLIFDR
jgi:hypothetical protein